MTTEALLNMIVARGKLGEAFHARTRGLDLELSNPASVLMPEDLEMLKVLAGGKPIIEVSNMSNPSSLKTERLRRVYAPRGMTMPPHNIDPGDARRIMNEARFLFQPAATGRMGDKSRTRLFERMAGRKSQPVGGGWRLLIPLALAALAAGGYAGGSDDD